MPLVCKDLVDILDVGVNSTSANHTSLSNFAFLYGVFPTAPSVAIYAGHYNMELEVVSLVDAVKQQCILIIKRRFRSSSEPPSKKNQSRQIQGWG